MLVILFFQRHNTMAMITFRTPAMLIASHKDSPTLLLPSSAPKDSDSDVIMTGPRLEKFLQGPPKLFDEIMTCPDIKPVAKGISGAQQLTMPEKIAQARVGLRTHTSLEQTLPAKEVTQRGQLPLRETILLGIANLRRRRGEV